MTATVFEMAPLAVWMTHQEPGYDWYGEREFYIGVIERIERLGETPRQAGAGMVAWFVERLILNQRLAEQYPWLAGCRDALVSTAELLDLAAAAEDDDPEQAR
jgi:hypothetical protein